ncbi:MAG: SCO family protein [Acidimicrobiales bacterium]
MPGMGSGLHAGDPTIVAAFKSALLEQGIVALLILAAVAIAWQVLRVAELRRATGGGTEVGGEAGPEPGLGASVPEAPARRFLRVGFGCLWILDGILQAQPQMPLGMTSNVIRPAAAASPGWVQHVVNAAVTIWSYHPIQVPASAVWLQVGIGLWLLVATRGAWSRLAGLAAVGWGLVVWVFGEAFGGIFAPGVSWLFGAPGAVLLYALAGGLVALPEGWWSGQRVGRWLLRVIGLFFVGMAVLQAWPGRGFWHGHLPHRGGGTLMTMARQMAATSQPHAFSSSVGAFASFDAAHGFAVNLFVVVALGVVGAALSSGRGPVLPYAVAACCVLCLADWVLVEDFGFFGGTGTDPNSMIPLAMVVVAGYLGVTRAVVHDEAVAPVTSLRTALPLRRRVVSWWQAATRRPAYLLRTVVALGAVGIVLLGAVPMAFASINPNADPIIAEASAGSPANADYVPSDFSLVDQLGRPVSLTSLHGKTVALTFLDPVCNASCPLTAQYFREADGMLGSIRPDVELVAVVANPLYRERSYLVAFDREEDMTSLGNWRFLTGSLPELESVWRTFGIQVQYEPGGAMIGHSSTTYVLDRRGHVRLILDADPGPGTPASQSSFAVTLASAIRSVAASA